MRFLRPGRLAAACRRPSITTLFLITLLVLLPRHARADEIAGQVVDPTGRPLPRAYVRVLDGSAETFAMFTDDLGRFRVAGNSRCQIEASLTGFTTTAAPCGGGDPIRIVMPVAPVKESIVVSATRTDAPLSQTGATATVFTSDDLEVRQEPLLADLLVGAPGAMLLRNGQPGTVTSLFVRGGESDYNKILLDGVPLNEPGGTFYLSNLTTENLERIEYLRGAYSTLFGSDANASVIQLFTKRASADAQRPQVTAQFDGGTYSTFHESAAINGAARRVDYSAAVARIDTDNRVPNSALENTTLSGTAGARLGSNAQLRFVGRMEREHVGTPGQTAFGRPDSDAFFERHDRVVSISFDQSVTRTVRQRASYSLALSDQQSTNLHNDGSYTASYMGRTGVFPSSDFLNDTSNELGRHHASYQADLHLATSASAGDHTLTVLADWDGERATSTNHLTSASTTNARDNVGVSIQEQMLWRRLFVTAGGRVEHNDSFGTEFVPRGSVVFVAHQTASGTFGETRVRASAGTGVKEPTMLESFGLSPFARGNPNLTPERSRSAEVGVDQRFARDRARVELSYFDNHFTDIIDVVTTNPATFEGQYQNVAETRARGLELATEVAPHRIVRARASYTYLDGLVLATSSPTTVFTPGNELFRRPRHSGSVGVTLLLPRLTADLNGAFIGEFVDSDFGLFFPSFTSSPGHTLWDARIMAKLTRQISALLMIDNLANADYSEPLGYQPLLRTFRVGVRVRF
jgi:outer membrane cobalamin receptor